MMNQEQLREVAESYLKSIIADASSSLASDFDSSAAFAELGIDSFHVLKIIKKLEAEFGTLPKTLLFENFNVNDLAGYFVKQHDHVLAAKFAPLQSVESAGRAQRGSGSTASSIPGATKSAARNATSTATSSSAPQRTYAPAPAATPILLLEKQAYAHPELGVLIAELFERHKNEGSVSRGARNIAPNLFIGSERRGYFNYSRCKNIILAYAYTGPDEYFAVAARELYQHCTDKNFQLTLLTDRVVESVGEIPFSSTAFGALQRIVNLRDFTLEGGAMRRLRYQVSKFEKAGACRTEEYRCGTRPDVDRDIARVIDKWCAARTIVNPLVHIVREEILAGSLHPQHRLFLTYVDQALQNVILISALAPADNGYLMDLEFYAEDMPLGGLEFAIVRIIEILAAEGRNVLSLGGTYGCRLEAAANTDPAIDKILEDLHKQNVFNDDGNLQFKNKFRPETRTVYLCRPAGSGNADTVIDIIMMIADPAKMQTSDEENHTAALFAAKEVIEVAQPAANAAASAIRARETASTASRMNGSGKSHSAPRAEVIDGEERSATLAKFGFNPLNIPAAQVEFDLKTDSWAQLNMPAIQTRMRQLHAELQQPVDLHESLRAIFPFAHFALTVSGRTAEHAFYKAWPKKGVVLQNLLFPTALFHQIDQGFDPCELPHPESLRLNSAEIYQGNIAWEALQAKVAENPGAIALVCIELTNNAAGGHPVSTRHLREVKALLARHSIPLVIDGTRVVENAQFLIEHEPEHAGKSLWAVAQHIFSHANAVICSLPKDFGVTKGGLIATSDAKLLRRLQDVIEEEGSGLDAIDQKLIALALRDRQRVETQVVRRMAAVRSIGKALQANGVPVVRSAGAHCILIDVKQIGEFQAFEHPVAAFLAWMYLNSGIRAGAHSVGMQKRTAINDLVRIAIPVGLKQGQVDDLTGRLVELFRTRINIPELVLAEAVREVGGEVYAKYELKRYHGAADRVVAEADGASTAAAPAPIPVATSTMAAPLAEIVPAAPVKPAGNSLEKNTAGRAVPTSSQVGDIAITGMAGRYPKAKSVGELWENLARGVDCITNLPAQRYERRRKYEEISQYRGGFIDDIDRFDSLFFNISPREAEMLDPQERLFLEVAWEAVEDAGYYPEILARDDAPRNIGVFVGAVWAMYQMVGIEERHAGNKVSPNSFLWSIANRVSYFMNLSGPSLTLDTACSSSLTAIHLACEAIHRGECSSAIVGGVNLDLHQGKLDINLVGGALSKDGVCRSFGKGANGYVAGEGIGAIFLKPLDQALQDGDHIHGVIKGIAVNHGGRTSGYTVPNPKAQASLIVAALDKAGVDARSIGYIEAHGTGTELGDPIETAGLTQAFEKFGVEHQSCALGSIKTNIGHLEAAAGVVSVCKVLLQMKHRALAPSLHAAEPNEFIDFERSPFYVVQALREWQPKEVAGVRFPLRAGISSFGAGGSNAHVILESYEPPAASPVEPTVRPSEQVFPLSARNEDQLREAALRLRSHLQSSSIQGDAGQRYLDSVSYTLQVGRKSFDCRAVIIAGTAAALIEGLTRFIDGKRDDKILVGNVKNADGITRLLSRKEQQEFVALLSRNRDSRKLAQLWIDGLLTDWQGFHARGAGQRVPLPTYPFADKRHWVPNSLEPARRPALTMSGIHPLIDSNESTFERQLFKKTFHLRDFFIYDHLVADIATLPGVAYLELARKAGEIAAGRKVQRIRNILWLSPIAVQSAPKDVFIELKPSGDVVHFEVFSENESGARAVHSQGKLLYATAQEMAAEPEYIDLAGIRSRCTKVMEGAAAYPLFKSFGLGLGPSFQSLHEVYKNSTETLGVLQLPESRHADLQSMLLHPSLVDGSLQAGVAAQLGDESGEMLVPYSLGEVEILQPLPTRCFSYVTKVADSGKSRVSKGNVLILDEHGKVLVRIRESTGVPLLDVHKKPAPVETATGFAKLHYSYEWEKAPLNMASTQDPLPRVLFFALDEQLPDLYRRRLESAGQDRGDVVVVRPGESYEETQGQSYQINPQRPADFEKLVQSLLQRRSTVERICFAWPLQVSLQHDGANAGALDQALQRGVYSLLFLCQALVKAKVEGKVQLLCPYIANGEECESHNDAINGFAKALHIEHPKFFCKTVAIQQGAADLNPVIDALLTELRPDAQDAASIRYRNAERYVRRLRPFDITPAIPTAPNGGLRDQGVYLITGGAGGLGLIFAEFLAKACKAKLVLTGRSKASDELAARFDQLRKSGAEVLYVPADVSDRDQVQQLVDESKRHFGALNGIVHSAGVLRDSYLRNKTHEEMAAVFAPKIHGTVHLDAATRHEPLDFFVMFSSLSAVGGNAGQCDYCFANHFMDSFAREREALRAQGTRSGKTLSLNWSLWADGGMKLDAQTELLFTKATGIRPLQTETGLQAFSAGLASGTPQIAVVEGVQEKIELAWGLRKKEPRAVPSEQVSPARAVTDSPAGMPQSAAVGDGDLVALVQRELSQIVVEFLKLDLDDVAPDKVLLDLGFDSIGLATYANQINDKYGIEITPVLFFDYPSIQEIAKHLCAERKDDVLRFHKPASTSAVPAAAPPPTATADTASAPPPSLTISKGWNPSALDQSHALAAAGGGFSPEHRFTAKPIAIVGMSGVMPESADLEEFWANLRDAKDMITVIPEDRWNWRDYYGDPLKEANKSNSKWGGFIKEIDKFDPLFFGISPREAQMMDPQQRLFLETVWKAVEDSGQKVSDLQGTKTGLFVGVATNDYADLMNARQMQLDGYTASGNSHSVLANRVSFLLNLRGPSAPLDTACSSSLVAIHRAIESIHSGSCEMAIVGGVQVMISPAAYISFSMAGMLSGDGKCKSFDKRANGYVRGEGVGAIFLKPLAMAEADGNHIYAVIKATAENHGGRVTTLTAPNSAAQSELLIEAYEKARVDPSTVGYIECHGTGTSLGDPIEIQALSKAFAELYKRNKKAPAAAPHCGLSSVKTNIGHLETAAGIAGVLKALLAIKHRQIPANIHFEELNPYIKLGGTPFYIADKTVPWPSPTDERGTCLPRRAGVSSFGFGGANAHVVLEEYIPAAREASHRAPGPQLIVLSAKNEDRLLAYAQLMLAHLQKHDTDLADFAYTLQVGRDEMPERLALLAATTQELQEKLGEFIDGKNPLQCFRGNTKSRKSKASPAIDASVTQEAVQSHIKKKELGALAELWVSGAQLDWHLLHEDSVPRRIAIPTYPFARERCWIPDASADPVTKTARQVDESADVARLHPLIHRNVSTLQEQKFAARFSGEEFFLADHVVESDRILPGVAYMEMARAAGQLAADKEVRCLRNLVWLTPVSVGSEPKDLEVSLVPGQKDIEFTVRSLDKNRVTTHCSGKLGYSANFAGPESLDIAAIQQRCPEETLKGSDLYAFLGSAGLKLGKGFQIVQQIYATESESLAVLKLPQHLAAQAGQYWLHPALMDGSLHTAIGLMRKQGMEFPLSLPFSVREIQIIRPLTDLHYGYATWATPAANVDPSLLKINFHLLDRHGNVLVRMLDFICKPLRRSANAAVAKEQVDQPKKDLVIASSEEAQAGLQTLLPVWSPVSSAVRGQIVAPASSRVLLLDSDSAHLRWAQQSFPNAHLLQLTATSSIEIVETKLIDCAFDQLLWIAPDVGAAANDRAPGEESFIDRQEQGVLALFRLVKALLRLGYAGKPLQWTFITSGTQRVLADEAMRPAHAGVMGLVGSLAKEYPHWNLRLLDVDSLDAAPADECLSLAWDKQGDGLAHRQGAWFRQGFARVTTLPQSMPAYRQGGVYVVIGGAGGLGEVWSRYLIEHYQARLIWIGRQECTAAIEDKIESLSKLGPRPEYVSADASRLEALEQAWQEIRAVHPLIHGVVHSAIVLQDQSIAQMEECTFRASLAAKVDVSVNMATVFGQQQLDFMLFFSSIVAFHRSPGQSNYAAGCTFKDSFAQWLQGRCAYPVKIMNWGFWGNVGIVANASYKKLMEQMGVGSIEPHEGMASLQGLVSSEMTQMALIKMLNTRAVPDLSSFETIAYYPKADADILPQVRATLPEQASAAQLTALATELPSADQDALVMEILASSLQSLGCLGPQGTHGAQLLFEKQRAQFYRRWLAASIRHLQQHGWLDASFAPQRNVRGLVELWSEWDARKVQWTADANRQAQVNLLEACLRAVPAVLSGKQLATDVIFPRSSMQLVEGMYRGNALADYFNEVLGQTLAACMERWLLEDGGRKIRILEIGAGTGGTTSQLLPVLQRFAGAIAEYCYTDVSKAFLMYAVEHYQPRCPALTTAIFDVTKPLAAQSIAAGTYDVVIASNVLHATPRIRETVRNAKAALKANGVLLLNEISNWSLFSHLTFGLLEGWWLHEDSAVRLPGNPGLAPEQWRAVLKDEGFPQTFFPAEQAHGLGQQIVAASSDGVVRQRAAQKMPTQPAANRSQAAPTVKVVAHAKDSAPVGKRGPASSPLPSMEVSEQMGNDHIQQIITGKLSEALQLDAGKIRSDESFADYGVDSIIGVNLVNTINETLQIDLETTSLFEYNTVATLSAYIWSNWKQAITARIAPASDLLAAANGSSAELSMAEEPDLKFRFAADAPAQAVDAMEDAADARGASVRMDAIAIVGMSGRFAESESLEEFWQKLIEGQDLVKEVSRWSASGCVISEAAAQGYCSKGSFIDSLALFDPAFFRISPLEARYMDPQQRLFLEESWKALEDAGYAGKSMHEKQCGVYVGCGRSKYEELFVEDPPAQAFWGNSDAVVPARIAYYLNLRGPAIAVNTACSSSLVTIHLACQGLWSRETDMALAGGVFLQATAGFYQVANRAGMLSPTGRCCAFDASADGFVPGEGVGVIVLKRLADALRDADHIHGVLAGSGINQDGASNGLIAPNAAAQEALERSVYERFNIDPANIQLLEAHGTGTLLGDSIEYGAITRAFRKYTDKKQFCAIGSVKTNIGHAATAAGIASVLKVLLSMKHRQLPPSLHFQERNPAIDFASSPFYLNTQPQEWQVAEGEVRRAAVSSFGFGGTNAHLVIEEAPAMVRPSPQAPAYMVVLSARTSEQLQQQARNLVAFLNGTAEVSLNDLSYTLLVGRMHLDHRLSCIARSQQELVRALEQWIATGAGGQVYTADIQEGKVRERPSLKKFGNHCLQECRNSTNAADYLEHLGSVADLYAQGYSLDFATLFRAGSRRIPLPTYPFARERYWTEGTGTFASAAAAASHALHPLLHANTSDLSQQSYSSTFTGEEWFLRDHQLSFDGGAAQRTLPAVACLEMARAALEKALPLSRAESVLELHHTVWSQPIAVAGRTQVSIALLVNADEQIDFEIYGGGADQERVHCQGQALFSHEAASAPMDIAQLRSQMQQGTRDASDVYAALSAMGLHYGPAQRAITVIHKGEKQRLAELRVPAVAVVGKAADGSGYGLHPSVLEGALQAGIDLLAEVNERPLGLLLPQALECLRIASTCTGEMLAWVRFSHESVPEAGRATLDIDLVDMHGNVCAQLRSLSFSAPIIDAGTGVAEPATRAIRIAAAGGDDSAISSISAEEKMELFLKQEAALQLQIPLHEVPMDRSYFDLGLTSLGIANLIHSVNKLLDENLPPTVAFKYRDIAAFAAFLAETHPGRIAALSVIKPKQGAADAARQPIRWNELAPLPRKKHFPGKATASSQRKTGAPAFESIVVSRASQGNGAVNGHDQLLEKIAWGNGNGTDESEYERVTF